MKKTELFQGYSKVDYLDMHLWDCWVTWRSKQAGAETGSDEWYKIMEEIPNFYDWSPWRKEGYVTFTWDGGEENIPLEEVVDDLDKQSNLTMLWHEGYWDGPLNGVADLDGEMVWYDLAEEGDDRHRTYNVFQISEEDKQEVIRRNRKFCEQVGYHCYHTDEHREYGSENPPAWCPEWIFTLWRNFQFRRFYFFSQRREKLNLTDPVNLIGVFDESQFNRRK